VKPQEMPRKSQIKMARACKAETARLALNPMAARHPVAEFSQIEAGELVTRLRRQELTYMMDRTQNQ
jgi:hypothetical protein